MTEVGRRGVHQRVAVAPKEVEDPIEPIAARRQRRERLVRERCPLHVEPPPQPASGVDRIDLHERHSGFFLALILTLDGLRTTRYVRRPGGRMRASIVMVLCAGCGVLGGGKSLEGAWEGQCDAEDDDGNNYDYELSFDLVDLGKGDSEGDGEFDSTIVLTTSTTFYYFVDEYEMHGEGDVRAEYDDKEHTIDGSDWLLDIESFELDDTDTADWTLVGERDGDDFTGEFELDLAGDVTVRGDCSLNRS
jgi:hypothetical protein